MMMMRMMNKTYLINRVILFPPYNLWKWLGNCKWFGYTLFDRYKKMNELTNQLQMGYDKMRKEHPEMVKDLDTK